MAFHNFWRLCNLSQPPLDAAHVSGTRTIKANQHLQWRSNSQMHKMVSGATTVTQIQPLHLSVTGKMPNNRQRGAGSRRSLVAAKQCERPEEKRIWLDEWPRNSRSVAQISDIAVLYVLLYREGEDGNFKRMGKFLYYICGEKINVINHLRYCSFCFSHLWLSPLALKDSCI